MKTPDIPADETHRLDALRSLAILDTPPEADFDAIVALGCELFEVPICLVSLVDAQRQWFKACVGLTGTAETSRAVSFCGHAILREEALVVADATNDERFADNPLVTGPPHVRFYAGMPIRLPSGYQIGTVCIIDREPRTGFDDRDRRRLSMLSELAVSAMAVRGLRSALDSERRMAERMRMALHIAPLAVAFADTEGRIAEANSAFADLCRLDPAEGGTVRELLAVPPEDWSRALAGSQEGEVRAGTDGTLLRVVQDPDGLIFIEKPESD
jgi:GAF domain-containing protein